MASERFEADGVTLTDDECREVLAFWERGDGIELPACVTFCHTDYGPLRRGTFVWQLQGDGSKRVPIDATLIDAMRDHLEPWQEVRRDEVKPGEVFRVGDAEVMATVDVWKTGELGHVNEGGNTGALLRFDPVLVRRPRPTLTLGDAPDGAKVRRVADGREGIACYHYEDYPDRHVLLGPGKAERWLINTPVELVRDDRD